MILIKIHARVLTELGAALLLRNEPAWRRYHPADISKGSTGVSFPCPSLLFFFLFFSTSPSAAAVLHFVINEEHFRCSKGDTGSTLSVGP